MLITARQLIGMLRVVRHACTIIHNTRATWQQLPILRSDGTCYYYIPHSWPTCSRTERTCACATLLTQDVWAHGGGGLAELFMSMLMQDESGIIVSENNRGLAGVRLHVWLHSTDTDVVWQLPTNLLPNRNWAEKWTDWAGMSADLGISQPWPALHQNYNGDGRWRRGRGKATDLSLPTDSLHHRRLGAG